MHLRRSTSSVLVAGSLLVLVAACGGPVATATPGATPAPTADATDTVDLPPQASASTANGAAVPGDLGTFSWNGLVSDSPWVVGSAALAAEPGGAVEVALAEGFTGAWEATWAPVVAGVAGGPVPPAVTGTGDPIRVPVPGAGSWSLRVELVSGADGTANWYWQVAVGGR